MTWDGVGYLRRPPGRAGEVSIRSGKWFCRQRPACLTRLRRLPVISRYRRPCGHTCASVVRLGGRRAASGPENWLYSQSKEWPCRALGIIASTNYTRHNSGCLVAPLEQRDRLRDVGEADMNRFIAAGFALAAMFWIPGLARAQEPIESAGGPVATGEVEAEPVLAPADSEVDQTELAAADATAPSAPEIAENDPNEVIFRTRRETGTNFRQRICLTRRQTERAEIAAEHALEWMRRGQPYSPN